MFEVEVVGFSRVDQESGKVELHGTSATMYEHQVFVYVPLEQLKNYHIGQRFQLVECMPRYAGDLIQGLSETVDRATEAAAKDAGL